MDKTDPAETKRTNGPLPRKTDLRTVLDLTLKIGIVILMIILCFRIINPFTTILLWAIVIAVILHPVYNRINRLFGQRRKISAVIMALAANAVILVPSYFLFDSLFEGLTGLAEGLKDGTLSLPPPPESIAGIGIAGTRLHSLWLSASENIVKTLGQSMPLFRNFLERIFNALAGTGIGILQFALSIIISVLLLVRSDDASSTVRKLFRKLIGDRGEEFAVIAEKTIRNVAAGVIGVALIQSTLIGAALMIMEMPMAGLWVVVTLIVAIAQIPLLLVTIPMVVWLFVVKAPLAAVLWSVFLIIVGLLDNVLKPVFMGKGSDVPMLVVFLGAIGGFVAFGFLGLFLGSIILSLGYKLYIAWLDTD